jgi:hypothetical protein
MYPIIHSENDPYVFPPITFLSAHAIQCTILLSYPHYFLQTKHLNSTFHYLPTVHSHHISPTKTFLQKFLQSSDTN